MNLTAWMTGRVNAAWLPGCVFALCACLSCSASTQAGIEDGPRHIEYPSWMKPGIVDLQAELEQVRADGRHGLMVLYTTQGCTYCAEFIRTSLGDPALVARLRHGFAAVGLEIFDDAEMTDPQGDDLPIKRFAEQTGAAMAPTLLFFDRDGELVYRAVGYQSPQRFARILDYVEGGHYRGQAFRDYIEPLPGAGQASARPMREDPLFARPPYALSRRDFAASQPLLVIFETTGCAECERFHDKVLALPEVRELLARFELVRLDAADTVTPVLAPDGRPTTPSAWYAAEGFSRVPALLYADEHGRTVFKTDAVVERQRMLNASGLVLERAYEKGWSYQRFARSRAIARSLEAGGQGAAAPGQ